MHTINASFQHAFSPTLSGNVTFGYAVTQSDDPDIDDDSAIVGNINFAKTLRTGQASFGYRQRFTSGGGEGSNVLARTFVASFSARISPKVTARLGGNLSFFDFQEATDDRLFFVLRPSLSYQILRFWLLSVNYDYAVTNFDESERADETNHRLTFASQFTLREKWVLSLTYRYSSRRFAGGFVDRSGDEFDRNIIELTLIYAPTFRF